MRKEIIEEKNLDCSFCGSSEKEVDFIVKMVHFIIFTTLNPMKLFKNKKII